MTDRYHISHDHTTGRFAPISKSLDTVKSKTFCTLLNSLQSTHISHWLKFSINFPTSAYCQNVLKSEIHHCAVKLDQQWQMRFVDSTSQNIEHEENASIDPSLLKRHQVYQFTSRPSHRNHFLSSQLHI